MFQLLKTAFLNNFRRKMRTFLAVFSIALGIASLILLIGITTGMYNQTAKTLTKLQGLVIIKKGSISSVFSRIPYSYYYKIKSVPGVKEIIPEIIHVVGKIDGKKIEFKGPHYNVKVVYVPPNKVEISAYGSFIDKIKKGRFIKENEKGVIVISEKIADEWNKNIGSVINIDGKKFKVVGIFESDSKIGKTLAFISKEDIRNLYGFKSDEISDFYVLPYDLSKSDIIAKQIEFKIEEVDAKTQQEIMKDLGAIIYQLQMLIIIVSVIASVVAAIVVINTMLMSVLERFREIGALRAVGWTKSNVITLILLEAAFIGIYGGLLGLIIGLSGGYTISTILPFAITKTTAIKSFLFAFFIGLFSGIYPAYVASNMNPIDALREE